MGRRLCFYRRCPSCFLCRNNAFSSVAARRKRSLSSSESSSSTFNHHNQSLADDSSTTNSSRILDVSHIAEEMRHSVRQYTRSCRNNNTNTNTEPVRLAGILAADAMVDHTVAELYSTHIAQTLAEDGIVYEHVVCPGERPHDVEAAIQEMNHRDDVSGILVYYPIFRRQWRHNNFHQQYGYSHTGLYHGGPFLNSRYGVYYKCYDDHLRNLVRPEKDVEGLKNSYKSRWHFRSQGKLLQNCHVSRNCYNKNHHHRHHASSHHQEEAAEIYVPCTALSVARILEAHHNPIVVADNNNNNNIHIHMEQQPQWHNTTATVINRSEILGRPLAVMLALKGATVYSVDENSILLFQPNGKIRRCTDPHVTLDWCLEQSSIVVTGVPDPNFELPLDSLGANSSRRDNNNNVTVVNVSEFENVNEQEVMQRSGITFIPHVGKVTVAALEQNLIKLHQQQAKLRET